MQARDRAEENRPDFNPENSPQRDCSMKLNVVARQLGMQFSQAAARSGLTRSHWTTIAVVARRPAATQREIAEALHISEVSAGRLVEKLAGEGLLRREPSPSDRRAYLVHLTEAAAPILQDLGAIAVSCEAQAFAGFSESEIGQLTALLDRIGSNLDAAKDGS